jgi:hypothetical protein
MSGMLREPSVGTKTLYLYKTVLVGLIGHRPKDFLFYFLARIARAYYALA